MTLRASSVRSGRRPMIPDRLRRVLEDAMPWYDRVAEARHDERSDYIHTRSIANRVESERVMAAGRIEVKAGIARIRAAYALAAQRIDR